VSTVVCIGNEMRGDDGAGPVVAARLRAHGIHALVEAPANLIHLFDGLDDVVVVEAVQSGAPPETIRRIDLETQRQSLPGASTHLLGLADSVELARTLGRLPLRLRVIGIERQEFGHGTTLSPAVDDAIERVVDGLASRH